MAANLQDTVLRLTRFWVEEGCLVLPGADQPLAAGIEHPQAFAGLFGEAPYRRVFVQTVRRPADGRHGTQPYRLARHQQVVVLLRPAPDELLPIYLRSLRAVGAQLDLHDLRFAEGDWRSAVLDAWGLGWNVRLDGLGVTRVTWVQQAGGQSLDPVAAEITYGVERLVTCLAEAPSTYDIDWSAGGPRYGALRRRDEEEASRHAFAVVETETLRARFEGHREEAERCLAAALPGVAYEAVLRAADALAMLSARRALAPGERRQAEEGLGQLVSRAVRAWQGTPNAGAEEVHDGR